MPQKPRRTFTPDQTAVDPRSCFCGGVHCEAVRQTGQPSGRGNGIDQGADHSGGLMRQEWAELTALHKELKRVQMERDVLKKAATF